MNEKGRLHAGCGPVSVMFTSQPPGERRFLTHTQVQTSPQALSPSTVGVGEVCVCVGTK